MEDVVVAVAVAARHLLRRPLRLAARRLERFPRLCPLPRCPSRRLLKGLGVLRRPLVRLAELRIDIAELPLQRAHRRGTGAATAAAAAVGLRRRRRHPRSAVGKRAQRRGTRAATGAARRRPLKRAAALRQFSLQLVDASRQRADAAVEAVRLPTLCTELLCRRRVVGGARRQQIVFGGGGGARGGGRRIDLTAADEHGVLQFGDLSLEKREGGAG